MTRDVSTHRYSFAASFAASCVAYWAQLHESLFAWGVLFSLVFNPRCEWVIAHRSRVVDDGPLARP